MRTMSATSLPSLPFYTFLRVVSVAIVAGTIALTRHPNGIWLALVFSVGFGHYALSVIYAKEPIRRVLSRPRSIIALLALALLSYALFTRQFSLLILFAIHHVFNEVYLPDRVLKITDKAHLIALRFTRLALNAFAFVIMVRHAPEFVRWDGPLLYAGLAASAVALTLLILPLRKSAPHGVWLDLCAFEAVGLLMVALSFYTRITFLDIVLYHFVFWALYPLPKMFERGPRPALTYLGLNVALTTAFFLVSPSSPAARLFNPAQWEDQFRFWSYFHIATAFALSTAFPVWITRWFRPISAAHVAR